jgi:hypothetical protein
MWQFPYSLCSHSVFYTVYTVIVNVALSPLADYTDRATAAYRLKLVPTFDDRDVVSVTDPHGRILGFLDRSRYFFFQVAPQLYSRG